MSEVFEVSHLHDTEDFSNGKKASGKKKKRSLMPSARTQKQCSCGDLLMSVLG